MQSYSGSILLSQAQIKRHDRDKAPARRSGARQSATPARAYNSAVQLLWIVKKPFDLLAPSRVDDRQQSFYLPFVVPRIQGAPERFLERFVVVPGRQRCVGIEFRLGVQVHRDARPIDRFVDIRTVRSPGSPEGAPLAKKLVRERVSVRQWMSPLASSAVKTTKGTSGSAIVLGHSSTSWSSARKRALPLMALLYPPLVYPSRRPSSRSLAGRSARSRPACPGRNAWDYGRRQRTSSVGGRAQAGNVKGSRRAESGTPAATSRSLPSAVRGDAQLPPILLASPSDSALNSWRRKLTSPHHRGGSPDSRRPFPSS